MFFVLPRVLPLCGCTLGYDYTALRAQIFARLRLDKF